jgi:hypothetical protein
MGKMEEQIQKWHPTIACCGIDCGLCPRYYTEGKSKCPGCLGENFLEKHPACSIITCCVKNNGFETCAECPQFPCEKIKKWDIADSFVTHKKSLENLRQIKERGIEEFLTQQQERITILNKLIKEYDDGKSKSFFCLASALMEIDDLNDLAVQMEIIRDNLIDRKQLAKLTRSIIEQKAKLKGTQLRYRRENS